MIELFRKVPSTKCGPARRTASLVGTDPLISTLFIHFFQFFHAIKLKSETARVVTLLKIDQEDALVGSAKSTRCRCTNLIHFALTSGSDGKLVYLHSRSIACVSTASVIWCFGHTIPMRGDNHQNDFPISIILF